MAKLDFNKKTKLEEKYAGFKIIAFPFLGTSGATGVADNGRDRILLDANTTAQVVELLKEKIRNRSVSTPLTGSKATADFNVEFTRVILDHVSVKVRFFQEDGNAMIEVSDDENETEKGFTKLSIRVKEAETLLYLTSFTPSKIIDLRVEPHGRYYLVDETKTVFGRKYTLILDSVTGGPHCPKQLGAPGVTIACW